MKIKVAINGFGRIGRLAFRQMFMDDAFEIVAVNNPGSVEAAAHLLKYDSSQGSFHKDSISWTDNSLVVDGKSITFLGEFDAKKLPWKELNIDLVIESTGAYTTYDKAHDHIDAGAKRVLISAPAKGDLKTIVYNVNHEILDGSELIISAASCTTNCLAPIAKILDDNFGLVKGFMNTIHAYTNDQRILDAPHDDLRRARSGAVSIIPTTTGAASAVGLVLPNLKGRLDGMAMRVPVVTGSVVDLVCELNTPVTKEMINSAVKNAQNETVGYTEDPIVSVDIIGTTFGTYFDAGLTSVMEVEGKQMVKVISWYDNEMSYTAQMVRTAKYFGSLIK